MQNLQKKMKKSILWGTVAFLLIGCGQSKETAIPETKPVVAETQKAYDAKMADSLDQAVLLSINKKKETVTLHNIQTGKNYTLSYTGATTIEDKRGEQLVMDQLEEGSLITVTFLKDEKLLKSVFLREDATVFQDVSQYEINRAAKTVDFEGKQFQLDENVAIVKDGEKLDLMDVNAMDTLMIQAVDHTIYSMTITKGHGYLKLLNYDFFVGGWIEIGQSIIKPVTEEMLMAVPEGKYQVYISKDGVGGIKEVEVASGEEVEMDVADLQGEIVDSKVGQLLFTITPDNAHLFIDGNEVDYSKAINLGYGVHKIVCKADGYATLSKFFKVSEESATINIELEDVNKSSVSSNTVSGNSTPENNRIESASSEYKVYIDAPVGAELYVDDNYVGLIPTSFPKKKGTNVISVRKAGYQTRSYTLSIDDSAKDVNYSFSELLQQ